MPNRKLNKTERDEIRDRFRQSAGTSGVMTNLAKEYNVTHATISRLLSGHTWREDNQNVGHYLKEWGCANPIYHLMCAHRRRLRLAIRASNLRGNVGGLG